MVQRARRRIARWLTDGWRYLIHSPFFSDVPTAHQAKWTQMEELKAQGLTKSIGVSNYLPEHLEWILATCRVPPAVNQIEFHPYLQHPDLLRFHKEKASITFPGAAPHA